MVDFGGATDGRGMHMITILSWLGVSLLLLDYLRLEIWTIMVSRNTHSVKVVSILVMLVFFALQLAGFNHLFVLR